MPVACATTGGLEGASCAATSSADAIAPGAIQEARATAQVFRVRVYDSGATGVRENGIGDDRIFAHQGINVP